MIIGPKLDRVNRPKDCLNGLAQRIKQCTIKNLKETVSKKCAQQIYAKSQKISKTLLQWPGLKDQTMQKMSYDNKNQSSW